MKLSKGRAKEGEYSTFDQIDGEHSLQDAVANAYVLYDARVRSGGKVAYFNFKLAKEMGLLSSQHPHELTTALCEKILKTFSIQIVNEYDLMHQKKFDTSSLKSKKYMATRYLQLQHPDRKGKNSGDGRSVWNGEFTSRGITWDITSCGTGATRLSPATAIEKKFFKTGDTNVCYGCGYSDLSDGLAAALMSEVFHNQGIATERTLAVIEFNEKFSINVRAGKNLLRPSHLFRFLKLGDLDGLKGITDYYITRQKSNGDWQGPMHGAGKYDFLALDIARKFSNAVARFESDYIFCWLDWDGDNILMNGGIIDYGSVRQFGLYHHEYRYDDTDRFSTTIPEQYRKARYMVQTFAQLVEFLKTGRKQAIRKFRNHTAVREFDRLLQKARKICLLQKVGFSEPQVEWLLKNAENKILSFMKPYQYFERAKSARGPYEVPDGIMWDAVFCMSDILRELPQRYQHQENFSSLPEKEFLEIAFSTYARPKDKHITKRKIFWTREFQKHYFGLVQALTTQRSGQSERKIFTEIAAKSSVINRLDRITGDAILNVTDEWMGARGQYSWNHLNILVEQFIQKISSNNEKQLPKTAYIKRLLKIVAENRQGI